MKFRLFVFSIICFYNIANAQPSGASSLLSEIIRFESLSGCELETCNYLVDWSKKQGLYVNHFGNAGESSNFMASLYPLEDNKPNIVLMSHLDIVPVMDVKSWKQPPFSGEIVDDTIWGRGAIDCKGLAVMQLLAIKAFKDSIGDRDIPYNISFLGVSEEETNSENGAKKIVDEFLEFINPIVVFGEGGSGLNNVVPSKPNLNVFGISVAEKSSLWLRLEVQNKTYGHGAVPPDLYANKKLIKILINLLDEKRKIRFNPLVMEMFGDLGRMEGGSRGFFIKHINWNILWPFVKKYFRTGEPFSVLVQNTFTITQIESSADASNQISDRAFAVLDCRLLPGTDVDKFIKRLKRIAGHKVNVTVIAESPSSDPSYITSYFTQMENAIKEVYPGSEVVPILFPASTDNNYFRQKGIPTYGIIPARLNADLLESVHNNNERICLKDVDKGIEVYKLMLRFITSR